MPSSLQPTRGNKFVINLLNTYLRTAAHNINVIREFHELAGVGCGAHKYIVGTALSFS